MLKRGDRAPEFALPDPDGRQRRLSEMLLGGSVVLYFYPADFTPGCTREACDFRDLHARILGSDLQVVGISPQSPDSHRRFRETHALPFLLLSDEEKLTIRAYGVDGPFGMGVRRASFLIDDQGRVEDAVLADFIIARHRKFVERAIGVRESRGASPPRG